MRALIAGCGYVGSALAAELARRGHQVWGLRRSGNPGDLPAGVLPLTADITRLETLAPLQRSYDWVIHCVSASGGGEAEYRRVYLEGTRQLLTWLAPTPPQKFIYTSSTGVYGQNDGSWVDEHSPATPAAETGRVLVAAEELLLEAARHDNFPALVLRVAGIYGPGRGYWLKQYLKDEVQLEGGGERLLNMIHRDDVVGALIAALERGRAGEIYNAVDDEPVTLLVCFQWLSQFLGRPMPPFAEAANLPRKRGVTNKRVANTKLKGELGYLFKYPTFREGFAAELSRGA